MSNDDSSFYESGYSNDEISCGAKMTTWIHPKSTFLVIISWLTILSHGILAAYESKWERVDALAQSLFQSEAWVPDEASRRLGVKNEILEILYEQEAGYPIYYVDSGATGTADGSSWENAFTRIQDGVDMAYSNGEGWVWVAEGEYTYLTEPRVKTQMDGSWWLKGAVQLLPGVMLFGGFSGNETSLEQRNPEEYVTVIRGRVGGDYGVDTGDGLRGVDMAHQTLIDGFKVIDSGYKGSWTSSEIDGGGIRTRRWLSIIRNNKITGCYSKNGAGIAAMAYYFTNSSGVIESALDDIEQYRPGYSPIIERNIIYNNHAVCGSGAQLRYVEALFCHNIVAYNSDASGQKKHKGVEVVVNSGECDRPVLVNNIVWGNVPEGNYKNVYTYSWWDRNQSGSSGWLGYHNFIQNPTNYPENASSNNVLDVDPQFNNVNGHDYTLKPTSPCIGSGLPLPDGTPTDIGFYKVQYHLTIDDGDIGASKIGEGWYTAGDVTTISTDSVFLNGDQTVKYSFNRWTGVGSGSYSGTDRTATVQVEGEITETIVWDQSFALQIHSDTQADQLSGWYTDQSSVQVVIPSQVTNVDEKRVFSHWEIHENGSVSTSPDTNLTVTISHPVVLTAVWDTEYRVRIQSPYGSPTLSGDHWFGAGEPVTVAVEPLVDGETGSRYRFQAWQGTGASSYSGTDTEFAITLNSPVQETAVWQTEHYLTVVSESGQGSPQGQGWYLHGTPAVISVDSLVQIDTQNRDRFFKWNGEGTGSYGGRQREYELTMHHPVTETVIWSRECRIDVTVTPDNAGTVQQENVVNGWAGLGAQVVLQAEGDAENGYGFAGWAGAFTGRDNPLSFQMSQPVQITAQFEMGNVRVETEPAGLSITADGAVFTCPRIFYWLPGETYTLGIPTPQQSGDLIRYIFDRWSDGKAIQHPVVIPEDPVVYTAYFEPEYRVLVESDYGMDTVQGDGWYNEGDQVTLSIDSLTVPENGTRHRFTHWTSEGAGMNGQTCIVTFSVQEGVIQQAHWQKQVELDIHVSPSFGGHVEASVAGSWHDTGTEIQLTAVPIDTHFTFAGWSGDIQNQNETLTLTLNEPLQITAGFITHSVFPPEISGFPDTTLFEDGRIVFSRAQFESMVVDRNDPVDSLTVNVINDTPFSAEWDGQEMLLSPFPDWHGNAQVVLEVMDPRSMAARDTIQIQVISLPDPPGTFSLLHPFNHIELSDSSDMINFQWEKARNVDEGDAVHYEFYIGKDSLFQSDQTWRVSSIQDTFLILNRNTIQSGGVYWGVRANDQQGYTTWCDQRFYLSFKTGIEDHEPDIHSFVLSQNYPNPFNASTQFTYHLPNQCYIRISVFDARGREICSLLNQNQKAGEYRLTWDAKDDLGMDVPSGIYIIKLLNDKHTVQKKMLLVR